MVASNPPIDNESTVSSMALDEKVGQLFVAGFDGTTPTAEIEGLIAERRLGGIIYFSRNVDSPDQLRDLSRTLQGFVPDDAPPLLVSIDQEGGRVARLAWGTEQPSAMAFGATADPALARHAGEAVGHELRSLGIDVNLAPVLDVNNNSDNPVIGVRSFGERPETVAELGTAYADGLQGASVVACGKHFPGHGDTTVDSHRDLPVIDHDRDRLDRVELRPFRRAIDAGIDAVMTTHVVFPTIVADPERPATLSPRVVTGLLRKQLGFDGLVFTDCMEMDAIADGVGTVEGCVQAVEAGCDQICVSHTPAKQRAAIDAVVAAVESRRLSESRIDESVRRVLRAKRSYGAGAVGDDAEWVAAATDCRAVARTVAERSVTLVRDDADNVPLSQDSVQVLEFEGSCGSLAEETRDDGGAFAKALAASGVAVDASVLDAGESPCDDLAATSEDLIVVRTSDVAANPEQAAVVRDRLETDANVVVVATASPYDIAAFPAVGTYLTTYDGTPPSLATAADVLVGRWEPTGRLPVSTSDDDSR
ncbi:MULTISPECIES: beta-N-acetylhexosaminidase [Halorussus]|uniref:beta-N-acetylhexosaminidase n=1 Tax=Halorussus TaxID=1070314 RepID=UPI0020A1991A|nr:beta-N-acetylhexosaminidase [Halorussus vallis]USZ78298.1 beta-N-acetylhexosaminidase [Halorussus vallis]